MAKIFINGIHLFWQQLGKGKELVMIHGLAANRAFWYLPVAQPLADRFHITLYDLRGHGYSDISPFGYTSSQMAEDLQGLLEEQQIERPILVGHSFGGVVALNYSIRYPKRVAGLVLADSRIHSLQPTQRLEDSFYRSPLEEKLLAESELDWKNEIHLGLSFLEEVAKERWQNLRQQHYNGSDFLPFGGVQGSKKTASKWLRLMQTTTARQDFQNDKDLTREEIGQLDCPLLAIYGEKSRCLNSCEALEKLLPHCQTKIVPDAGHFHPVTRPEFFINALITFCQTYDLI